MKKPNVSTAEGRREAIMLAMQSNNGKVPKSWTNKADQFEGNETLTVSKDDLKQYIMTDVKDTIAQLDVLRKNGSDISLADFAHDKYGFANEEVAGVVSPAAFYKAIGIELHKFTIEQLTNTVDLPEGYRWITPEIIREAVRHGLRNSAIYPSLIAGEETVSQPKITMPGIEMSDAMMYKLAEKSTIPVGAVNFRSKEVKLDKYGIGFSITDECRKFCTLSLLSIFMQDVGAMLNIGLDSAAINTLINGEQADGSEAAPTIGVASAGTLDYQTLLRSWIRMSQINRLPSIMLSDEAIAMELLNLAEFKDKETGTPKINLNLRTAIPTSQDLIVHGAMPATNTLMLINPANAMIKLNAQALTMENERIASRQFDNIYASMWTGFAILFRDARLLIDKSLAYSGNGFPSYMSVKTTQQQAFKVMYA